MRLIGIAVVAWLSGIVAYITALDLLWGESISSGDFSAVLSVSLVATLLGVVVVYGPVLARLKNQLGARLGFWPYPLVSVILGIGPVLFITAAWGGTLRSLLSPEVTLFYCMFATFGLVFGVGYFLTEVARRH